jgi:hypothetical protein
MDARDVGRELAVPIGGLVPLLAALALVPVRGEVHQATVALVLMAAVVLAASIGDRRAGLVAAVTATMSYDFFSTHPYLSLKIESSDDVQTALVLLATGLVVGTLTSQRLGRQRHLERAVARGADEVARLHRVADLIAHGAQPAEILFTCERELTGLLRLEGCDHHDGDVELGLPRLERNGALRGGSLRFVEGEFALPVEGVELPILHLGQQVGAFLLTPDPDVGVTMEQRLVAVAIADQAGAAIGPRLIEPR